MMPAIAPLWIAGDWHLGPWSPPAHGRLARAFLEGALDSGAEVILNGDVFDELFAGAGRSEAAHPGVVEAMGALGRVGRLRRTCGNHDPDAGPERLSVEVPALGRVLVAHGHTLDPIHASPVGRLGDAASRRFGRHAPVRLAAALAEHVARALAEGRMAATFRARCLRAIDAGGYALGVFGHLHRASAAPGDRYVNAGALTSGGLEYAVVDGNGARIERSRPR